MLFIKKIIFLLACSIAFMGAASACDPKTAGSAPTLAQYQKLKMGMTVKEVEKIIGTPGSEQSYNEIGGIKSLGLSWIAHDGTYNIWASFSNGKLAGKGQDGLK